MSQYETIEKSINDIQKHIDNDNESGYKNIADSYLPIGPQSEQNLNWNIVNKKVIERLYQLTITESDWRKLREIIKSNFIENRNTRELADLVDELYLSENMLSQITPLAYLIQDSEKPAARTKTMIDIFQGLIFKPIDSGIESPGSNPLECLLIEQLVNLCSPPSVAFSEKETYLPFLAKTFTADIHSLSKSPSYFLEEFENLLRLYSFLYVTQLAINLCNPRYRYSEPEARPLYFILETEAASKERHECNQYGFDYIFGKSGGFAKKVFPYLGYFQRVMPAPCWKRRYESQFFLDKVNEFNSKLALLFDEQYQRSDSITTALNEGANFHMQMFEEMLKKAKKNSRKGRNKNIVDTFEKVFGAGFVADRKRAGKYFVLNSSMLLLLTNLIIGGEDRLLIDDVIDGFNQRGIWLDIKSKKALLKFYENVGNVEKMSDSGDAVYVKGTI